MISYFTAADAETQFDKAQFRGRLLSSEARALDFAIMDEEDEEKKAELRRAREHKEFEAQCADEDVKALRAMMDLDWDALWRNLAWFKRSVSGADLDWIIRCEQIGLTGLDDVLHYRLLYLARMFDLPCPRRHTRHLVAA